jgi:pimeloyl-ACP methyl ester carboxylesterase
MSEFPAAGITLGYDDTGRGDPLVLVHGHPFDRTMWRPQVAEFARTMRVITPDLRGYGESDVVPGITLLETFARDLAALLDHLGVDRVILGGLSMGGQIAMEFHRLFPERLRALVLADTFATPETPEGREARNAMADRLLRDGMDAYAAEVLPKMITPASIAELPAVADHVLTMMRGTSREGAAAALRGRAERPDYLAMLPTVSVPVLVLVGSEDEYTPVSDAEAMCERLPDATLVVINGTGHLPNLEQATGFNQVLGRFLESIRQEN